MNDQKSEKIDDADRRLLARLQEDCSVSMEALAEAAGMSANTAWRRVRRMEEAGIIARRVAILDPDKIGAGVTVFVTVRTSDHSDAWLDAFARTVRAIPEVVEFYRMSGETDYLMKLQVASIADYDRVYKTMIRSARLQDVSSSFAMETIKYSTALPLR